MFLHREFVPLLPIKDSGPAGPTSPPFFQSDAPPGWWESSAEILHHAADSVVEILAELGKTEKSLMTPLIGFSAFTAALTHAHVAAFPHVNLGRSTKAEERADAGMAYLVLFTKTWKMGEEWVSTRPIQ
jgi:hypothetical protein